MFYGKLIEKIYFTQTGNKTWTDCTLYLSLDQWKAAILLDLFNDP